MLGACAEHERSGSIALEAYSRHACKRLFSGIFPCPPGANHFWKPAGHAVYGGVDAVRPHGSRSRPGAEERPDAGGEPHGQCPLEGDAQGPHHHLGTANASGFVPLSIAEFSL